VRVYVIGDSVMLGARDTVVAALPGWQVTVDAQQSLSLLGAISTLQARRAEMGDVVVVELGSNDGTDRGEWRRRIDLAMSALAGVPRVIWVTQHDFQPGRAAMNEELEAAAARFASLDVADWNAVVATYPGLVGPDGVHLTAAGQASMAKVIADHVGGWAASTTTTSASSTTTTTTTSPTTSTTGRSSAQLVARPPSHGDAAGADALDAVYAGVPAVGLVGAVLVRRRVRARGARAR